MHIARFPSFREVHTVYVHMGSKADMQQTGRILVVVFRTVATVC